MRYLYPRLSYYYFRFRKTDVRHNRILLPFLILTYSSSSAWQIASVYQISSKSVNARQNYDVLSIFQDGGHDVANLLPVTGLATELV